MLKIQHLTLFFQKEEGSFALFFVLLRLIKKCNNRTLKLNLTNMHIGQKIKEVMQLRHRSVIWVAQQIACERTNVYNIFAREDISTGLLRQLSIILEYDFFKDLSADIKKEKSARKKVRS